MGALDGITRCYRSNADKVRQRIAQHIAHGTLDELFWRATGASVFYRSQHTTRVVMN
jgi:hypothetical protein